MKFKIKYQAGNNILVTTVDAPNELSARYKFYMEFGGVMDIISIEEENNETKSQ